MRRTKAQKRQNASVDLTKYAKGKPCMIRLPGCSYDPAETRLCHKRMSGISGGALKAPDLLAAWGCHFCALATENGYEQDDSVKVAFYDGVMRTQAMLIKDGIVVW